MKKITKNNLKKLCRTCMKTLNLSASPDKGRKRRSSYASQYISLDTVPELKTTNKVVTNTILELLQEVQPQIVHDDFLDELPEIICNECVEHLLITHSFLKVYQESDLKFREFLKNSKSLKSEDVQEIVSEEKLSDGLLHVEIENLNGISNVVTIEEDTFIKTDVNPDEICDILKEELEEIAGFVNELKEPAENVTATDFDENDHIETEYFELEEGEEMTNDDEDYVPENEIKPFNEKENTAVQKKLVKKKAKTNNKNKDKTNEIKPAKRIPKRKHEAPPEPNEDGTYPCKYCADSIKGVTVWRVHMRQHRKMLRIQKQYHNPPKLNDAGLYPCDECESAFDNLTKWKQHMKEHKRKRTYIRLNRDLTTKTYKCEFCGKEFLKGGNYKYHLKEHTGRQSSL